MRTKRVRLPILLLIMLMVTLMGLPLAACTQAPAPTITKTTTATQTVTTTPTPTPIAPPVQTANPEPILQRETWPTYTNNDDGYTIQHPSTWILTSGKTSAVTGKIVSIKGPGSTVLFSIMNYEVNPHDTITSLVDDRVKAAQEMLLVYRELSRTDLMWQGIYPACEWTFLAQSTESNHLSEVINLYLVSNSNAYILQAQTDESENDSYSSTFDAIINSFRLTAPNPSSTPTSISTPPPIPTPPPTTTPKQIQYTLSTSASPTEGGIVSPTTGNYDAGTSVTLMAIPSVEYQFASWSGNAYGTGPIITITMDTNKNVAANFMPIPTPKPLLTPAPILTSTPTPTLVTETTLTPTATLAPTVTPTTVPAPTSGNLPALSHAEYLFRNSASVISWDETPVFLGKITSKYDGDSVLNKYGNYGSKYSTDSMWNKYGDYGGKYSSYSPFNRYSASPPKIYIGDTFWGYLSVNRQLSPNVLDPNDLLMFAYSKYGDDSYLSLMVS